MNSSPFIPYLAYALLASVGLICWLGFAPVFEFKSSGFLNKVRFKLRQIAVLCFLLATPVLAIYLSIDSLLWIGRTALVLAGLVLSLRLFVFYKNKEKAPLTNKRNSEKFKTYQAKPVNTEVSRAKYSEVCTAQKKEPVETSPEIALPTQEELLEEWQNELDSSF